MNMAFTDEETLPWIKRKIQSTTRLNAENNTELYGAMHILCSEFNGMERYVKSYKCDDKQGAIANLYVALQQAIDRIELTGGECSDLRNVLAEVDRKLGISTGQY